MEAIKIEKEKKVEAIEEISLEEKLALANITNDIKKVKKSSEVDFGILFLGVVLMLLVNSSGLATGSTLFLAVAGVMGIGILLANLLNFKCKGFVIINLICIVSLAISAAASFKFM